jgi:hypothetical protein
LSLVKAVERATGIEPALPVWKAAVKRTLWVQPAPIVSAPATLIAFFTAVDSVSCHEPCHATHAVRDCLFLQRRHKGYIRTRRVTGSGWEASHSPTGGDTSARLLDVVADRSASALVGWMDQREPKWRQAIANAALDPYRGYASARSRSRCFIDDCVLAGLSGRPLAARGEHRRIQQPLRAGPPPRRSDTSSAPPPPTARSRSRRSQSTPHLKTLESGDPLGARINLLSPRWGAWPLTVPRFEKSTSVSVCSDRCSRSRAPTGGPRLRGCPFPARRRPRTVLCSPARRRWSEGRPVSAPGGHRCQSTEMGFYRDDVG